MRSILAVGVLLSAGAAHAFAEPALCDEDCGPGFTCGTLGASGCDVAPCAEGEDCPEPEPCDPQVIYGCVPAPCENDDDCGSDLVCLTVELWSCEEQVACVSDTDCPETDDPDCSAESASFCAPRYVGGCEQDADCGEGFTCETAERCVCSDGGSAGGGEDDPAIPEESDCTCEEAGRYCQPQEIDCTESASVCPEGWSCSEAPTARAEEPCVMDPESGETTCPAPEEPEESRSFCLPPYWEEGFGYGSDGVSRALSEAAAASGAEVLEVTGSSQGNEEPSSRAGCSIAPAGTETPDWKWIGLVAALGLIRRRRSRSAR